MLYISIWTNWRRIQQEIVKQLARIKKRIEPVLPEPIPKRTDALPEPIPKRLEKK
jgi:hypothetical protein